MKKTLMAAVAVALVAMAGSAMADTTTVAVTATVTGTCRFNSTGTVDFTLDPSSGGNATGTVTNPSFWCTNGAGYTISDDFGANEATPGILPRRMKRSGTNNWIPYSISYTAAGSGTGKNSPITMDISAAVLNADFVDALAGSYADTVTLTIAP